MVSISASCSKDTAIETVKQAESQLSQTVLPTKKIEIQQEQSQQITTETIEIETTQPANEQQFIKKKAQKKKSSKPAVVATEQFISDEIITTQAIASFVPQVESKASSTKAVTSSFLPKNLSLSFDISASMNLVEQESHEFAPGSSFTFSPAYKISSKGTLIGVFNYSKDLNGLREERFSGTNFIGLVQKIKTFGPRDIFKVSAQGRTYIPLSTKARKDKSMITRFMLRPQITSDFTKFGLTGLALTYKLAGSTFIHKYDTNVTGGINPRYNLSNIFQLRVSPMENLGLSTQFIVSDTWDYLGEVSQTYVVDQSLSVQLFKSAGLTIGYSNQGDRYDETGSKSEIDFFDFENSEIYSSITFSI